MFFRQLFDPDTSTYTYVLADEESREAVIIDPVRERSDRDLQLIRELRLDLAYVLETHVHADHVTGAHELRQATGAQVALSAASGARHADVYIREGDLMRFGKEMLQVRATPGHTEGCVTYVEAYRTMAFTGDALLIRGSGRTDFQQGSARKLYESVREKILTLPDTTRLYPGHDYQGRSVSTVAEEKAFNPRLGMHKSLADFEDIMANLKLPYPRRIEEALPANLRCGTPAPAC